MRITDPRLAALPATNLPDAEMVELMYSLIVQHLSIGVARQAARLITTEIESAVRTAAANRLDRAATRIQTAEAVLTDLAATAAHPALTAGLPAITAARAHLATTAGVLRAGWTLRRATTSTTLVVLPSEAAMRAAREAMVGAHALSNTADGIELMAAEPELRAMARLALTAHDGTVDLPNLQASWRTYVLLLGALFASGAGRRTSHDRYQPDAARFVATLMRFRASQLETRAKLGVTS